MRKRRGIIRRNFGKLGLLGLALMLGMGSLTIGYTAWTDTLTISGTVTTGQWVQEQCGTGYAYGGEDIATPFTELLGHGPWGWSNGPLSPGSYEFDIYVGAGGGDINNGTLVGTLTVIYDGDTVSVTYSMDGDYTMKSTHLYVDTASLPIKPNGESTTAPGQYGNTHDNLNNVAADFYTVNGFEGVDIYVVAHAVVCWDEILLP